MTMSEEQAVEYITQRFIDAWVPLQPTVPYAFEGEVVPSADKFVSVFIQHTPRGGQMTQGQHPRIMRTGRIWVKIWTPAVSIGGATGGAKARAQLADSARLVYERQRLGPGSSDQLLIRIGQTQEGAVDGAWMLSAVGFDFQYYTQV